MAEFRIVDQYETEREPQEGLMSGVWQHLRSAGMAWGAVMEGRAAMSGYDRALRSGSSHREAVELALTFYAGPRSH